MFNPYEDDDDVMFDRDGNMWMAYRHDFINLQESCAGFGQTYQEAYEDLLENELK